VLLYHSDLLWMPGGFLGVDVFFVLSGFLITSLLLAEVSRAGRIDLRGFYLRRTRRLLPALLLVLAASSLLAATVARDAADQYLADLPPALLYVLNWSYVFSDRSYFGQMGRPPLLQHLWSLSIEEQFYLVWPAAMLVAWRLGGTRWVGRLALAGALLSAAWMAWLAASRDMPFGADASRAYFGTDTHAMGVLLGAALAVAWVPGRIRRDVALGARVLLDAVGLLALVGVLASFVLVTEYSAWLYRGGFLAISALAAVLLAVASHPASLIGRGLGAAPLRWLGERSYGLYLWHWPVFVVTRPGVDVPWDGAAVVALRLVLVGVLAELSFRLVEMPIRQGAFGRWWADLREGRDGPQARPLLGAASAGLVVVTATSVLLATATAPGQESIVASGVAAVDGAGTSAGSGDGGPDEIPGSGKADKGREDGDPSAAAGGAGATGTASAPEPAELTFKSAYAYGDSVILGAAPALRRKWPKLKVDAAVSRHIWIVADHIGRDRARFGKGLVVVHTGNNGPLRERDLRAMLASLEDVRRVVVVNQSMPRRWMRPNNALFAKVVKDYPNVRLADWAAAAKGRREWFQADQVHVNGAGAKAYARIVEAAAAAP
jgi:peptidoglycan/LPS O-acetylase OafA/YrhL